MSNVKPRFTLAGKTPFLALVVALIVADQVSKWMIVRSLPLFHEKIIIPGFFRLFYVRNPGAVWGIFSHLSQSWVPKAITVLSFLAFLMVIYYFLRLPTACRTELLAFSLVMAGAIGNITDRIRLGYVVDFIDLFVGRFHWPTFNIADSAISIGVVLLAWCIWRGKCTQF